MIVNSQPIRSCTSLFLSKGEKPKEAPGEGPTPNFDPANIPLEMRAGFFVQQLRGQLENSPPALARLADLTQEMVDLNFS